MYRHPPFENSFIPSTPSVYIPAIPPPRAPQQLQKTYITNGAFAKTPMQPKTQTQAPILHSIQNNNMPQLPPPTPPMSPHRSRQYLFFFSARFLVLGVLLALHVALIWTLWNVFQKRKLTKDRINLM